MPRFFIRNLLLVLFLTVISVNVSATISPDVLAQSPPEVNLVEGPATVDLGDVAQIELGKDFLFLNGKDTRKLMEYGGDIPTGLEVGSVLPKSEYEKWAVIFDYNPIGYVKDDEKDTLDSKAILEAIEKETEKANKIRVERGFSALNVVGWYEEPHYDVKSHNLVWAVLGEDADTKTKIVNYNTRLLGRHGYMAVTLIDEPLSLQSTLPKLESIIGDFSWKKGKSYAEWVQGDKVAEIGLTALIAGGAGAVLAKTGLLAKIWKFLVAGVVALIGAISALINRLRGKNRITSQ